MKSLLNVIIFGAIIGFLITSSDAEVNSVLSSTIDVISAVVKFIGEGLISLGKAL